MPNLTPGQQFFGYKLVSHIGSGQFGQVWRAEDRQGEQVALKFIPRPPDQHTFDELATEIGETIARRLNHPHLIHIIDSWQDEAYFIVAMELAQKSLRQVFNELRHHAETGIPRDQLLEYLRQAAAGIDHLNEQDIVHRDIKPDNLLILDGQLKVADFGLARLIESSIQTMSSSGTPQYMPPEVWEGRRAKHFSDQYSLAITYCYLRCGRFPLQGPDMTSQCVPTSQVTQTYPSSLQRNENLLPRPSPKNRELGGTPVRCLCSS
jgi:serine/threonine-protein kinase